MLIMKENFRECHTLPAINDTFPLQFNRPIMLLSPLDLSLRASDAIPITPPSTPSPPRKRQRFLMDEPHLWRPHAIEATESPASAAVAAPASSNYLGDDLTYSNAVSLDAREATNRKKNNYLLECNNFETIPENQASMANQRRQQQPQPPQHRHRHRHRHQTIFNDLPTYYVDDDETILLTEDEDETLGSSHEGTVDLGVDNDDVEATEVDAIRTNVGDNGRIKTNDNATHERSADEGVLKASAKDNLKTEQEGDEEDEYVDILSNDDDEVSPLSATALLLLQKPKPSAVFGENVFCGGENEFDSDQVLTRNKLVYDDAELHNRAVNGLAKLFERDFQRSVGEEKSEKTYTDLTTGRRVRAGGEEAPPPSSGQQWLKFRPTSQAEQSTQPSQPIPPIPPLAADHRCLLPPKTYKIGERKRMKLRKHLSAMDEDTISPVSGTIIRKLRDDEELVVRKGDIDPAFNVVEITEEAKAILASIDNKIGAYLCQLCRTLYDDAFQLAQHRCPRIVHIEYKCSECEKVFNCPANLASHRRWHKPKSPQVNPNGATKQHKQTALIGANTIAMQTRPISDETNSVEGTFSCPQCGKAFRRHTYLKKHLPCHQMIDNLKSLNIFKNCGASLGGDFRNLRPYPQQTATYHRAVTSTNTSLLPTTATASTPASASTPGCAAASLQPRFNHNSPNNDNHQHQHQHHVTKMYPPKYFNSFSFAPSVSLDQHPFYTLEDLYLAQHFEHNSAFQYVQATNATAAAAAAAGNNASFLPRPIPGGGTALVSVPVK